MDAAEEAHARPTSVFDRFLLYIHQQNKQYMAVTNTTLVEQTSCQRPSLETFRPRQPASDSGLLPRQSAIGQVNVCSVNKLNHGSVLWIEHELSLQARAHRNRWWRCPLPWSNGSLSLGLRSVAALRRPTRATPQVDANRDRDPMAFVVQIHRI